MWYELIGYVIGVKHEKVSNGQHHTFLGIHGLPETDKVLGERHRRFESYEDHLQAVPTEKYAKPIMALAKPGSKIVFRFFPDLAGPKAKQPGALIQYIEEVLQIGDHYFDEDGNEISAEQAKAKAEEEHPATAADPFQGERSPEEVPEAGEGVAEESAAG